MDALGLPFEREQHVVSSVVVLLDPRGPSAVLRGIIPIVVDAVETHPLGSLAHVLIEVLEPFAPAIADLDPASSLIAVLGTRRQITPLNHRGVDVIYFRGTHSVFSRPFLASATLVNANPGAGKCDLISAVAPTQPCHMPVVVDPPSEGDDR
jgi:hypothetical protein